MEQSIRDMYQVLDKEVRNLAAKGTVSPNELENAYKAICTMEKIKKMESMEMMGPEYSERGSSYGYGVGGYWPLAYGEDESYRRGRGSNGRFMSMEGRGYSNGGMSMESRSMAGRGDNYSGHSVKDRMIDALERMRDSAQSQAEMRDIEAEIMRIRSEK